MPVSACKSPSRTGIGERTALVAARMVLRHVAPGFVHSRDDDQLVTDLHSQECLGKLWFDRGASARPCTVDRMKPTGSSA